MGREQAIHGGGILIVPVILDQGERKLFYAQLPGSPGAF